MALSDIFKVNRRTFLNPRGWIDFDSLRETTLTIYNSLIALFTPDKPVRKESFDQAVDRLNLTEADIRSGAANYRFFAIFFLICGLLTLIYSGYLLFSRFHSVTGWMIGMATSALLFSQAFKFEFWSYQMRNHKLGVTYKEWRNAMFGSKGKSK